MVAVGLVQSQSAVDVTIDVAANRHSIDPRIYGVAHADAATLADLRIPFHRWGGNVSTRHNWQANASNRGADWYFESIADGPATPGLNADNFVNDSRANGAQPSITIPMAGWVAKVGASRNSLASFSVAKYGAQTSVDPWFPDAGNGLRAGTGAEITGNDPNDANVPSDPAFQRAWVQHLVTRWGNASGAGVRYYALDNEPGIWHTTHRDIHPAGASMDEVFNASVAHATQIKAVDPAAQVLGPEEWGWSGYLYSGRDLQYGSANGWTNLPDRSSHGNMDFVAWYLAQFRQRDTAAGQRLLDIFSLHYYPQSGEYGTDTSTAMQQRRNRSTRSLWDPNYVDESWIGTQVQLIPRMKTWVATHYPGTQLAITEYNWGAEAHINGATAQADILGIFGREALNAANFWTFPAASTPTYKAIKMYRNYDGQGSGFGDTSVSAVAPNPDSLSVFAAQRGTGALTIMAINKDLSVSPSVNFRVSNFTPSGAIQVWRLSSSNAISRLADTTASGGTITATLPTQTITLFVIGGQSGTTPTPPAAPTNLRILGGTGATTIAVMSGSGQTASVNTTFASPLRAVVRDGQSNPVAGATVTFTLPASGATARFGGSASASAVTDASGVATSPALTANGQDGSYSATASVPAAGTPATFTLANTIAPAQSPGGTWTEVTPSGFNRNPNYPRNGDNYGFNPVLVDPARASDFYAFTNYQGVWKSTDFGVTWTMVSTGTNSDAIRGGRNWGAAIDTNRSRNPSTPPTLYTQAGYSTVGKMGIWRSTDGGVNWSQIWNTIYAADGTTNITSQVWTDLQGIAVDPNNNQHLLTVNHGNTTGRAYDYHIFESTNGGQTWIDRGNPAGGTMVSLNFLTSTTWIATAEGWGSGSRGTFVTNNSGASWTNVGQMGKAHGNLQMHHMTANGTVYLAAMEGVFRATSPYLSWTRVDSSAQQSVIGTANYLYASFGWASQGTLAPNLRRAAIANDSSWSTTYTTTPSAMSNGAMGAAVSFNPAIGKYVIVTGNWLGGLWRYVE
jgi:hypothetical protein